MLFFDEVVENAWTRAQGRCESTAPSGPLSRRCGQPLDWAQRGKATHRAAWQALQTGPKTLGGWQAVPQTRIVCWACYAKAMAGQGAG